jgi:hypothetical protein|tara:strand:- start:70 stop:360 length:291 start_codon:yes stop_codon:yes gene_type:complete
MTENNLDDLLVEEIKSGRDVTIGRALLIVSGLTSEEQVDEYVRKIDSLQREFESYYDARLNSKGHKISTKLRINWKTISKKKSIKKSTKTSKSKIK